eukprot:9232004-Lingulodinium_polyedra.AAC.1
MEAPMCQSADLDIIAKQMIDLLHEPDLKDFMSLEGQTLMVGTLCSGSDVCIDGIRALARQGKFNVVRKFSCEIAEANQRWNLQQCQPPPDILYRDVM